MNMIKNRIWFKVISIVLIISFLSLDIVWAYPDNRTPRNHTLAVESIFQQQMMASEAATRQKTTFSDIDIQTAVYTIAMFLLGDPKRHIAPLPVKYLDYILTAEGKALKGVDLSHVEVKEDGVVVFDYINGKERRTIQIALRDNPVSKNMVGELCALSDAYIAKAVSRNNLVRSWESGVRVADTPSSKFPAPSSQLPTSFPRSSTSGKAEVLFSILDALDDRVLDEVKEAKAAGIGAIHIDYLDGKFTPGSEPFDCQNQVAAVASVGVPLEVHFMAVEPRMPLIDSMIMAGLKPGRDKIALHFESFKDVKDLWDMIAGIKSRGFEVSLVLNNETPLAVIDHLSDLIGNGITRITLMSIMPGATSRPFLGIQALEKISAIKKKLHDMGASNVVVESDGGVNEASIEDIMERGIDALVSRTWLLKYGKDLSDAFKKIMEIDSRIAAERHNLNEMLEQNGLKLDHFTVDAIVQFCKGSDVFLKEDITKYLKGTRGITEITFGKDRIVDIYFGNKLLRFHKNDLIPIEYMGLKDRTYYNAVTVKIYEGAFKKTNGKGYILGISGSWHDATAVLVKYGQIISGLEEERMTRTKHDTSRFPVNAIHRLLEAERITLNDIDHIAIGWNYNLYADMPHSKAPADEFFAKMDQEYANRIGIDVSKVIRRDVPERNKARFDRSSLETFLKDLKSYYRTEYIPPVAFVRHHQAHAAAAYYPCGFSESVLTLSIDGYGDMETATVWIGSHGEMEEVARFNLPNSLGWVYNAVTEYLNFRPTFAEGEVMGFAPYGEPRDAVELERVNKLREIFTDYVRFDSEKGELQVNSENLYYGAMASGKMRVTRSFVDKIGALVPLSAKSPKEIDPLLPEDRPYANLAFVLQETTERVVSDMVRYYLTQHPKTKNLKKVALSGGVALNILANGKLISEGIVSGSDLFVQPAASDSGTALGAALSVAHDIYSRDTFHEMAHAFYGPEYSDDEIEKTLKGFGLVSGVDYEKVSDEELVERAAQYIKGNEAIAWFEGRSELGPRALGARSILLNILDDAANNTANIIKGRQPWRPSASSITHEGAKDYYVGIEKSPFMITAFDVLLPKKPLLASGIHQYGKRLARPQTIERTSHSLYWQLLTRVGELIDVPAVVNTSFNKGEPLVENPEEAINTFVYMAHVDWLFMGHYIVKKNDRLKSTVVAIQEEPLLAGDLGRALGTGDMNDWDNLFENNEVIFPGGHEIVVSFAHGSNNAKDIYIPMVKEMFEGPLRPVILRYVASTIYNYAVAFGAERIYIGSTSDKMKDPVYYLLKEYLGQNFTRMSYFANFGKEVEILPFAKRGEVAAPSMGDGKYLFKVPAASERAGAYIGVDVGATRVKCVFTENGIETRSKIVDTTFAGGEDLKDIIVQLTEEMAKGAVVSGIGISVPGVVSPKTNEVLWLVNYEYRWRQRKGSQPDSIPEDYRHLNALKKELSAKYNTDNIAFLNDASAYGIDELGAKTDGNTILLALGTGAGVARIEDGYIDMNRIEQSGAFVINIGDKAVFDEGCAVKGGFAAYAGTDGIMAISNSIGLPAIVGQETLSVHDIIELLSSDKTVGVAEAKRVYYELAGSIVSWIKLLYKMRGDKRFIISGGSTSQRAGAELLSSIRKRLNDDLKDADISISLSEGEREFGGARGASLFAMGRQGQSGRKSTNGVPSRIGEDSLLGKIDWTAPAPKSEWKGRIRIAMEAYVLGRDLVAYQRLPSAEARKNVEEFLETIYSIMNEEKREFKDAQDFVTYLAQRFGVRKFIIGGGKGTRFSPHGIVLKQLFRPDNYNTMIKLSRISSAFGMLEDVVIVDGVTIFKILSDDYKINMETRLKIYEKLDSVFAELVNNGIIDEGTKDAVVNVARGAIRKNLAYARDRARMRDAATVMKLVATRVNSRMGGRSALSQLLIDKIGYAIFKTIIEDKRAIDEDKKEEILGTNCIVMLDSGEGHGSAYAEAMEELARLGKLGDARYSVIVYADSPGWGLDEYQNAYFTTYLRAVNCVSPKAAELPKVTVAVKNPMDGRAEGRGRVFVSERGPYGLIPTRFAEWNDMTGENRNGPGTEQDESRRMALARDPNYLTNANVFILDTEWAYERFMVLFHLPEDYRHELGKAGEAKRRLYEYWASDYLNIAADEYEALASMRPDVSPLTRAVFVGEDAPDATKTLQRALDFRDNLQDMMRKKLIALGVEVEEGTTISISTRDIGPHFDWDRILSALFEHDTPANRIEAAGVTMLKGSIHLDDTVRIGKGAILDGTTRDLSLTGRSVVERGVELDGVVDHSRHFTKNSIYHPKVSNAITAPDAVAVDLSLEELKRLGLVVDASTHILLIKRNKRKTDEDVLRKIFGERFGDRNVIDQIYLSGTVVLDEHSSIENGTWLDGRSRPIELLGNTCVGRGVNMKGIKARDTIFMGITNFDIHYFRQPPHDGIVKMYNSEFVGSFIEYGACIENATVKGSYVAAGVPIVDSDVLDEVAIEGDEIRRRRDIDMQRLLSPVIGDNIRQLPGVFRLKERPVADRKEIKEYQLRWARQCYATFISDPLLRKRVVENTRRFMRSRAVDNFTIQEIRQYVIAKIRRHMDQETRRAYDEKLAVLSGSVRSAVGSVMKEVDQLDVTDIEKAKALLRKIALLATRANIIDFSVDAKRFDVDQLHRAVSENGMNGFLKLLEATTRDVPGIDGMDRFNDLVFGPVKGAFVYLTDNIGEAETDALLWNFLIKAGHTVIVVPKDDFSFGDIDIKGVSDIVSSYDSLRGYADSGKLKIIKSGFSGEGVFLSQASEELADVLSDPACHVKAFIGKGQANLHTLSSRNNLKAPYVAMLLSKALNTERVTRVPAKKPFWPIIAVIPAHEHALDISRDADAEGSFVSHFENFGKVAEGLTLLGENKDTGQSRTSTKGVLAGSQEPGVENMDTHNSQLTTLNSKLKAAAISAIPMALLPSTVSATANSLKDLVIMPLAITILASLVICVPVVLWMRNSIKASSWRGKLARSSDEVFKLRIEFIARHGYLSEETLIALASEILSQEELGALNAIVLRLIRIVPAYKGVDIPIGSEPSAGQLYGVPRTVREYVETGKTWKNYARIEELAMHPMEIRHLIAEELAKQSPNSQGESKSRRSPSRFSTSGHAIGKPALGPIRKERLKNELMGAVERGEPIDVKRLLNLFPELDYESLKTQIRAMIKHGEFGRDQHRRIVEFLDIVDKSGNPTNGIRTFRDMHQDFNLHRAVHVLVVTPDNRYVFQFRGYEKGRNKWDISAAGHVEVGETPCDAAVRTVREELKLNLDPERFTEILPPPILAGGRFLKKGMSEPPASWVHGYGKDDIFRYSSRDKMNYELTSLYVLRISSLEEESLLKQFSPGDQAKPRTGNIRKMMKQDIVHDITEQPTARSVETYGSGASQYFDSKVKDYVFKQIELSSRPVYAFDYDDTLEDANWPLSREGAVRLARLITEKGARIAMISAKSLTEQGKMQEATEKIRAGGDDEEWARKIEQAREEGKGLLQFAGERIIEAVSDTLGNDMNKEDTENILVLYPSKSNQKTVYLGDGRWRTIYSKFFDEKTALEICDVLKKEDPDIAINPTAESDLNKAHIILHPASDGKITKIQLKPHGKKPGRDTTVERGQIATRNAEWLSQAGLWDKVVGEPGGATSIDYTPVGKEYGIVDLVRGDGHQSIRYFGDDPDGSDHGVYELVQEGRYPGLSFFDVGYRYKAETASIIDAVLAEGGEKPLSGRTSTHGVEITQLSEVVESTINNTRAQMLKQGNDLIDFLTMQAGPGAEASILPKVDKSMMTAELRMRVEEILRLSGKMKLPSGLTSASQETGKNIDQILADSIIGSIITLARRAKENGQKLIIGLETDWIPGIKEEGSQYQRAMTPFLKEIRSIKDVLHSYGLDNIEIVYTNSGELAGSLLQAAGDTNPDLSNIVVLASEDTINSVAFDKLRSTEGEKKAFLAAIRPDLLKEAYQNKENPSDEIDVVKVILEMLSVSLELAVRTDVKDPPKIPILVSYDSKQRLVIFLPKAEMVNYNKLVDEYKMGATVLHAA